MSEGRETTSKSMAVPGMDSSPLRGEGPAGDEAAASGAKTRATTFARTLRQNEADAEHRLWYELKARRLNGSKFVRQMPVGPFIADFACRTHGLIVELDGGQHSDNRYDDSRTAWLNGQGWSVLRFWNDAVLRKRDEVCETILAALDGRLRDAFDAACPSPDLRFAPAILSPQGRGMAPFPDEARPASLRSAPAPGSGEGKAPRSLSSGRPGR